MKSLRPASRTAVLLCAVLAAILTVWGCGDSDPNGPNGDGEKISDFTLRDVNENSMTHNQYLTFYDFFADHAVLLYFGRSTCAACRAQYDGLDSLVVEMQDDEDLAVSGAMVNHPADAAYTFYLRELYARIPALQDTIALVSGQNVPHIGYLLECLEGDELLLVDPQGFIKKRTRVGASHEIDLSEPASRETVKTWVRAAL